MARLGGTHAEYIAGQVIEPGEEIPEDAEDDVVEQLRDAGRLVEEEAAKTRKRAKSEEE